MSTPIGNNNLTLDAQTVGIPSAAHIGLPEKYVAPPKKEGFFSKLSKREQIMVVVLVVLVLGAALVYFAIVPAVKNYNNITDEIEKLRTEESQMQSDIAQKEVYLAQYDAAKIRYDEALLKYNKPMDPETLDETITTLVSDAGFEPNSLTMSSLTSEGVAPYTTRTLEANSVPILDPVIPPDADPATGAAGEREAADAALATPGGATADSDAAPNESVESTGSAEGTAELAGEYSSYVYSLDVTVDGTYTNLQNLISSMSDVNGLYLTTYSYDTKASDVILGSTFSKRGTQQFALTFKLYVFVQ
jgi:hypothetical protein